MNTLTRITRIMPHWARSCLGTTIVQWAAPIWQGKLAGERFESADFCARVVQRIGGRYSVQRGRKRALRGLSLGHLFSCSRLCTQDLISTEVP